MQHNIAIKIREYLPEIKVDEISFDEMNAQPYEKDLNQFTQRIQTWSHTILEKAKLPIAAHEAKALTNKYGLDKDEGCALRMVIELESMQKSLDNQDAVTAALASMKIMESISYSSIFKAEQQPSKPTVTPNQAPQAPSKTPTQSSGNQNMQHYQETINDLKEKYPHCNINALRLLAATRLNISKQELDDLNITPE